MTQAICSFSNTSGFCKSKIPNVPVLQTPDVPVTGFGTFERPFSVKSLWNSRPRKVQLGTFVIPESTYFPLVGTGSYSTAAFKSSSTDSPMTVYPQPGKTGIWDPDAEANVPFITIPRWPADTQAASGSDGHADIIDTETGIIHSFFKLVNTNGRWTALQYAWTRLDGRGFGDTVHYFQGARAAAVPSIAGVIRKHEINDGAEQYYHALAMSLTYTGLSKTQQYVFPATAGDWDWQLNTGQIAEGALVMLPPDFDESGIENPALLKVVKTLKTFGAYIIDRNVGTPFYIYVENGSGYNLHQGGWNSRVGNDLQKIRAALREVLYAEDWVDGFGSAITYTDPMNLTSMRGPWRALKTGGVLPVFDTHKQAVVYGGTPDVQKAENSSGRCISNISWGKPVPGKQYKFTVQSTNGGKGYLRFWGDGAQRFHTTELNNGQSAIITWPWTKGTPIMGVVSAAGAISEIKGILTEVV